jgi:precorrin-6x reductase
MPYRLKKTENAFQVCREGKFEYRRYERGKTYDEVPPEDAHRFEEISVSGSVSDSKKVKSKKEN